MDVPEVLGEIVRRISLLLIPILLVVDLMLTVLIAKKYPHLKSWYYDLHRKYDFAKVTVAKIIFAAVGFTNVLCPDPTGIKPKAIGALFYFVIIFSYLVDYMKNTSRSQRDKSSRSSSSEKL